MFWKRKMKPSTEFSKFIESHVSSWSTIKQLQLLLDGGSQRYIRNEKFDQLILSASIYAAADSFGQIIGADTNATSDGIKEYLRPYPDREDMFREVIIAGTMAELSSVVRMTGTAVFSIQTKNADVTATYMDLFEKLKIEFGTPK